MKYIIASLALLGLYYSLGFAANRYTVNQQNAAFDKGTITVQVGDTIEFHNKDEEFHNIFSLSDAAFFDLGSFGHGETRSHTFKEAGEVDVECALHPDMQMKVTVVD